ncbi:unnamed protein product [Toxocara canis]|uniref:DHO_dh domain-containing protein n=1 Tax=Toxocara canis TaxID=6265 RepID=A0A183TXA6_TOXCA|nr:unnamed protein product [Toxocara canis]
MAISLYYLQNYCLLEYANRCSGIVTLNTTYTMREGVVDKMLSGAGGVVEMAAVLGKNRFRFANSGIRAILV